MLNMNIIENKKMQEEEIESLSAIYDSEFTLIDEELKHFKIKIEDSKDVGGHVVELEVKFTSGYPLDEPPMYQLNAPGISGSGIKRQMALLLESTYFDNIGESVVYRWVEAIREFLGEHFVGAVLNNSDDEEVTIDAANEEAVQYLEAMRLSKDAVCPNIHSGVCLEEKKSIFQGHVAEIHSKEEFELMLSRLLENRKIAQATHNIQAYRIEIPAPENSKTNSSRILSFCDDDGENAAGKRLLALLDMLNLKNVAVVVSRWFGGVLLGPARFKLINNAARTSFISGGFLTNDSHSNKKKKA